jgi:16S rRNA (adenine1518-N6/adenine1519-N6)-dimethyltransferase
MTRTTRRPATSSRRRGPARDERPQRYPRARKRFGQHFLEPAWVARLVEAVTPLPTDTFLEIGPGRGALTRALAPRVRRLVCVEIDRDLAASLRAEAPPNVDVVEGDFLQIGAPLETTASKGGEERSPLRVIGNLPYNVASPILFKLLQSADEGRRVRDATVMLQKEVAHRLVAQPGNSDYGTLAIQTARVAAAELLFTLPPGAFRPPPKVTSAVVRLRFRPALDVGDPGTFERIVRGVFLKRRKTLLNALAPVAAALGRSTAELIEQSGVDASRRPEELTVADYARLSRAVL